MNTNFSSESIIKWLFTTDTVPTRPTSWYLALHDGDPGPDGTANEITDANYARQAVYFVADEYYSGNYGAYNDEDVTFPAAAATYDVTHVTVFDAATGGNALVVLELGLPRTVTAGGVFSIPTWQLEIHGVGCSQDAISGGPPVGP